MTADPYRVDVYQLNISVGDATLIVLSLNTGKLLKCVKGVLVDGGLPTMNASNMLIDSIVDISKRYYDSSGVFLTSIIVTHFDNDHVGGITLLLQRAHSLLAPPPGSPPGTPPKRPTGPLTPRDLVIAELFNNYPVKLYDPGIRTDNTTNVFGKYLTFVSLTQGDGLITRQNSGLLAAGVTPKNPSVLASPADASYHLGKELFWIPDNNPTGASPNITNYSGPTNAPSGPNITKFQQLLDWNNTNNTTPPRGNANGAIPQSSPCLYCIAINGSSYYIAPPGGTTNITPEHPFNIMANINNPNYASIALVLVDQNHKILHYMAGDAFDELETRLMAWINGTENFGSANPTTRVPSIKLSHHGSKGSTSVTAYRTAIGPQPATVGVLDVLKPQYIFISNGNANNHPDWETQYYLGGWKEINQAFNFRVYATNYPYYMQDSTDPDLITNFEGLWGTVEASINEIYKRTKKRVHPSSIDTTTFRNFKFGLFMLGKLRTLDGTMINGNTYFWDQDSTPAKHYIQVRDSDNPPNTNSYELMWVALITNWDTTYGFSPSNSYPAATPGHGGKKVMYLQIYYLPNISSDPTGRSWSMVRVISRKNDGTVESGNRVIADIPPAPIPLLTSDNSNSIYVNYNNGSIAIDPNYNSLFYDFVSALPGGQLIIDGVPNVSGWSLTGNLDISSGFGAWLGTIDTVLKITATFTIADAIVAGSLLQVPNTGFTCILTISVGTSLYDMTFNNNTGLINMSGIPVLISTIGAPFPSMSIFQIFSAISSIDVSSLSNLFQSSYNVIPQSTSSLTVNCTYKPLIIYNLQCTPSDPSNSPSVTFPTTGNNTVSLSIINPVYTFTRYIDLSELATLTSNQYEFGLDATILITSGSNNVKVDGNINLNEDGDITVSMIISNPVLTIETLFNMFLPGVYQSTPSITLPDDPTVLILSVVGNLGTLSVNSVSITVDMIFEDFANLTVTASLTFPDYTFYGSIAIPAEGFHLSDLTSKFSSSNAMVTDPLSTTSVGNIGFSADIPDESYILTIDFDLDSTPIQFGPVSFLYASAVYTRDSSGTSLSLSADLSLAAPENESDTIVTFLADYNFGTWIFSGTITYLSINSLAYVLDPDIQTSLQGCIPTIFFQTLDFQLDFNNSILNIDAYITIGGVTMDITYNYNHPANQNTLQIDIGDAIVTDAIDIGQMMLDMGFSEGADLLGIQINIPAIEASYDFVNHAFFFSANSGPADPSNIGYDLTIIRFLDPKNMTAAAKTIVWLSITPPTLQNVPIVGTLQFPIDNLFLCYASDILNTVDFTNLQNILGTAGVSDDSFDGLYNAYSKSGMPTGLQACVAYEGTDGTTDILAYVFSTATPGNELGAVTPKPSPSGATWFNYQKTIGPIQLARVGLDYDGSNLYILVDGSLLLDVIEITLEGFSIGIPCPTFSFSGITIGLNGLGIDISDGPLSIGGAFANMGSTVVGFSSLYEGGLTIGTPDFSLSAIGAYGLTTSGNTSFFIFGQLLADIGDPTGTGVAFITGLSVGFGYNQYLTSPTSTQVQTFPLIGDNLDVSSSPTPMDLLSTLVNIPIPGSTPPTFWISPTQGEKWFAAGVQITSWDIVDTQALLIVEFGTDTDITILARSIMNLPRDSGTDGFVYLELDISASLNPQAGTLTLLGSISPNSFVFSTSCAISGGFAIYTWFNPSQYAGDFVVTVGGYHPAFIVPAWYPQVDRLSMNWQIPDDCVSATGDLYFAVVPNCAMGGGSLNYQYNGDWVTASFLAEVNGIVYWDPFSFDVQVGVNIDAQGSIFGYPFDVEVSANIEIWGPPVGGYAEAEVYGYSFTIEFGDSKQTNTLSTWTQFRKSLPQGATSQNANDSSDMTQYIQIKAVNGLIPTQGSTVSNNTNTWVVSSNSFQFQVISCIPVTGNVIYNSINQSQTLTSLQKIINLAPLNVTNIESSLTIEFSNDGDSYDWEPVVQANINGWTGHQVPAGMIPGNAPGAIWGTPPTDSQSVLNQNGIIPTINGVSLQVITDFNNPSSAAIPFTNFIELSACQGIAMDYIFTENTTPVVESNADVDFAFSDITLCESQVYSLAQLMANNGMGNFPINDFPDMSTDYGKYSISEPPMLVSTYKSQIPLNRIVSYSVLDQGDQKECIIQTTLGSNQASIYYNGPIITGSSPLLVAGGSSIYQVNIPNQNLGSWLRPQS